MWVTQPGQEEHLPGVEAEAGRLRGELAQLEALSDESACRLCGASAPLTVEHAPSKKAGNQGRLIRGVIDYAASLASGEVKWTAEITQGATFETLCASCNSRTGSWYNPAYVRLARYCRTFARPENVGTSCRLELSLHRQRAIKQALTSIAATSQPGLTARHPHLRALLLGKEQSGAIAPVQFWFYLMANQGARFTGLTIALNLERREGHLLAEFAFWPLAWIMVIGDVTIPGAANVSQWSELGYHDKAGAVLEVPCQWAVSPYPGDFRGPEEFTDAAWNVRPAPKTPHYPGSG